MRQCISLYNQKFNRGAKRYFYSRQAKSYEKINIRIISKDIYIKNLIIAPVVPESVLRL
jgi:hypothetical protein